ncbi:MAG: RloB family protein [Magnetococcus sp. DMHC-1]|nr:RloB domain-containing protein [Magnetococcales bacterium]
MAIDNHPRIRQNNKLKRKKYKRASYDRILIVCEGEKTEVNYFEEIRISCRLQTANVQIKHSEYGTNPLQIVEYAVDYCRKHGNRYERIYCVFDRDEHINYFNAINSASAKDKKIKNELGKYIYFSAIPSNPCFELWLLLHFELITREIHRDEVKRLLRQSEYLPDYTKGGSKYFERTRHKLNDAFANVEKQNSERQRHGHENPSTAVGQLVKCLLAMGER